MIWAVFAITAYLIFTRKPKSMSDDRFGRLGATCDVCGFDAHESWHKNGDCWYES